MGYMLSNGKLSYIKRGLRFLEILSTYFGHYTHNRFLVPFILGAIKINNYDQVNRFYRGICHCIDNFVTFNLHLYLVLTDIHENVKKSMIRSGELFFIFNCSVHSRSVFIYLYGLSDP